MRWPAACRHFSICTLLAVTALGGELETLRDRQDRAGLERLIQQYGAQSQKQAGDAQAQYRLALAESYVAEIAIEQRDKSGARTHAEAGIKAAEKAVALQPKSAEFHRVLGTLCGQVIPANPLLGLRYGKCAQESVNKAVELDPKFALGYVSRGVGNYYLPKEFGGGVELAIRDFEKAIQLDPKSADAQLWLGIALRKAGRNAEARKALEKALQLNPNRLWAKQQLEKTPAQ
jgi:tetratricopeptide (TPR) repeat protein